MGCVVDASFMLIKGLEKLPKKTLRERIYEEVVRLIVSGELPSGEWLDEKQVIDRLRASRTPFREAIGTLAMGGLVEIKPYRGFYVRRFSRNETADLYELYKQQLCGTITSVSREFAERAAHGCDDIIQAFKTRDTARAACLVRTHIGYAQELILAGFPNEMVSR